MYKSKIILFFTVSLLLITGCQTNASSQNFDWLIGNWQRTNDEKGNQTFESWGKLSSTEYVGMGVTLNDSDTIFQEDIRLIKTNDIWLFEVSGVSEIGPTIFEVTQITTNSFTCENLQNEFPTHIQYKKEGDKLKAVIWAGEVSMDFEFVVK